MKYVLPVSQNAELKLGKHIEIVILNHPPLYSITRISEGPWNTPR